MDDEKGTKVRFETWSAEKIPFGKNNFLEVARKKAITDEGDSEFISVSRGYYLPDGSEKYKKSITIPDDPAIKAFVTEKINKPGYRPFRARFTGVSESIGEDHTSP